MSRRRTRSKHRRAGLAAATLALVLAVTPSRSAFGTFVPPQAFIPEGSTAGISFYSSADGPINAGPATFDPTTGVMTSVGHNTPGQSPGAPAGPTVDSYNGGVAAPGAVSGPLSAQSNPAVTGASYGTGQTTLGPVLGGFGAGVVWTSLSVTIPGTPGQSSVNASAGSASYGIASQFTGTPGVGLGIGGNLTGANEFMAASLYGTFTLNGVSSTSDVVIVATTDAAGHLSVVEDGTQVFFSGGTTAGSSFSAFAVGSFLSAPVTVNPGDTISFAGTLTLFGDPPGPINIELNPIPPGDLPANFIGLGAGTPVPEPSALALLGVGGTIGLGLRWARRRRMVA